MGYLYVRGKLLDRIHPVGPGWKAARNPADSFYGPSMDLSPTASKLDASLAWFPALADQAALGLFRRFGTKALLERNSHLALRLQDALAAQGLSFQPSTDGNRSTIVSVQVGDTQAVLNRFGQANVMASVRAGRIRLAVHFYNLEEELDRVAELIGRP
jgi:selenocysteine lyase/cysteine desulfurase